MVDFMGVTSSRPRGSSAPALGSVAPLARTILVVEDFDELRELIVSSLRELRYQVEAASSGGQAVRFASKGVADVIVMDVSLPVMNGIDVTRRIRTLGGPKRPHIIVASAHGDGRTRQLAFEAGCDQFIAKPLDLDALAATIDAFFVKRDGR